MTKFPMNQNTPKGQTHTIMESPVWVAKLYSYWMTFAVSWFSLCWSRILLTHKYFPDGLTYSFIFAIPLIASVYIDEHFTQSFFKRDWEESKKMDNLSIRGIPIPKIREYIEFHIALRKKSILYSVAIYFIVILLMWNPNFDKVFIATITLMISTLMGGIIRTKIGNDKFGFNSSYFKGTSEFRSFN